MPSGTMPHLRGTLVEWRGGRPVGLRQLLSFGSRCRVRTSLHWQTAFESPHFDPPARANAATSPPARAACPLLLKTNKLRATSRPPSFNHDPSGLNRLHIFGLPP